MERTRELDEWAEASIEILKKFGYIKSKNLLYVFTAFVIGITISGVFFYGGYNGWYNSIISQNVSVTPEINVTTQNSYDFNPSTSNAFETKNNYTIYNTIFCPPT